MLTSFKTYKEYAKQIRQIYKIYWQEGEQLWIEETRRELKSFYENHNFLFSHLNKRYKRLSSISIFDTNIISAFVSYYLVITLDFSVELPLIIHILFRIALILLAAPCLIFILNYFLKSTILSNRSLYLYPFEMELIKEKLATQYHFFMSPSPDTIALPRNNTENTENTEGDEEIEEIEEIKELEIEEIEEIE